MNGQHENTPGSTRGRAIEGGVGVGLSLSDPADPSSSVSSLASRFEQLAAPKASSSTAGPPARPAKPPALRANSSIGSANDERSVPSTAIPTLPARSRGLSNASNSNAGSALANIAALEDFESNDRLQPPPPIPFASRPSLSSPPSFLYGISPSASPARKKSRSPPPIPAPRTGSRPNTPSRALDRPSSVNSASTEEQDVQSTVAFLAARFGPALSRPTTPKPLNSPGATPQATRQDLPQLPQRREPVRNASEALQQAMSTSPPPSARSIDNPFASPSSPPTNPIYNTDGIPMHYSNRPLAVTNPPRPGNEAVPPPIPPPRQANLANLASVPLVPSLSAPAPYLPARDVAVPPALPARKQSEPALPGPSGSTIASSLPPLPLRTGLTTTPVRTRSKTITSPKMPQTEPNQRSPPQATVNPHARRETVSTSMRQHHEYEPYLPPPPPTRNIPAGEASNHRSASPAPPDKLGLRGISGAGQSSGPDAESDESEDLEEEPLEANRTGRMADMLDATFANRRPPKISPERNVMPKHHVNVFAVCGRHAVSAAVHLRIWDTYTGETTGMVELRGDHKVTALEYVFPDGSFSSGSEQPPRTVWAGTKEGELFEVDILDQRVLETKVTAHSHAIIGIFRQPGNLVTTVDECGKVQIWSSENGKTSPSLASLPRTYRMGDKHTFVQAFGLQLWSSQGPTRHHHPGASSNASRSPSIRIYDVAQGANFVQNARPIYLPESAGAVGSILAGTVIVSQPNLVYLAHESGHISVWEKDTLTCISVVRVSTYAITALEGVIDTLWAGNREGTVQVYDMQNTPWKVVKAWKAMNEPIVGLAVDLSSIVELNKLHIASYGRESLVFWDGLLQIDWLERYMQKRESEFSTYRNIKILICSWNIDSCKPTDLQGDVVNMEFLTNAVQSSTDPAVGSAEPPEIIVFGFQEVVDLENKKVTAKSMILGKKKADQMFQDQVSSQYMRWHDRLVQAVRTAMPASAPYSVVHAENLVGLLSLVFVRNSEKPNLSDIAKVSVKTGMGGRYGNKGAICARLVVDDTSICFLNCHLAAGQTAKRQRNKDLIDILENKSAFLQPSSAVPGVYIGGNGQTVFEHEVCFLSGDLNYRIDLTRSIVNANIRSSNTNLLLEHDQLLKEMKTNQAFRLRSFREANITFLPTYKFDPGTDNYDSSAKERIPAWCDRILYRSPDPSSEAIVPLQYRSWPANPSDHKPITGLFETRIKKMVPTQRQNIWQEAEKLWLAREQSLMNDARRYYL